MQSLKQRLLQFAPIPFHNTEDAKMRFFSLRIKRGRKGEYWALDSTSISSYSQQLNQVRYGHNKDHEPLPQLNLLVAFGEESNLPVYYRKLAGNIPDVKTVQPCVDEQDTFGVKPPNMCA